MGGMVAGVTSDPACLLPMPAHGTCCRFRIQTVPALAHKNAQDGEWLTEHEADREPMRMVPSGVVCGRLVRHGMTSPVGLRCGQGWAMNVLRGVGVRLVVGAALLAGALLAVWPGTLHASSTPTITSISPNIGATAGGTRITILGTDFLSGALVFVGGAAASEVVVVSSTQITAVAPARSQGNAAVLVVNSDNGAVSLVGAFFYEAATAPLALGSLSPASGPSRGGTSMTIAGTGFRGLPTVLFNGTPATNVTLTGSSLVTLRTPPGVPGVVTITLTNPDGVTISAARAFSYEAGRLEVLSISPGGGPVAGGSVVRISGNAFASGAAVTFGATPARDVVVVNSTTITAVSPIQAAGIVAVMVSNLGGASVSSPNGFTFRSDRASSGLSVTNVNPVSGSASGGATVELSGPGINGGMTVLFGDALAPVLSAPSPGFITVRAPANIPGPVTLTVINTDGETARLANGYVYTGPSGLSVQSVSPPTGAANGGTVVTITGAGFAAGAAVRFGTQYASNVWVIGESQIVATAPAGVAGSVGVSVVNPGGLTVSIPNAFTGAGATPPSGSGTPAVTVPLPAMGIALFVSGGGTNAQIVTASGCAATTLTFWVLNASGEFETYVPNVTIGAVNAAWNTRFASGVPAGTPLLGRCS